MFEVIVQMADHIVRYVPIVTWVGLLLALGMGMLWLIKRWPATPVLGLVCVLYAATPYMPTVANL